MRYGSLAIASLVIVGCANLDRRFLRDARIEQLGVAGACKVDRGHDVVLLLRDWDGGKLFTTDDEVYQKLTIQLPSVVVGKRMRIGDPGLTVVISDGSTGGPYGRCGSDTGEGSIIVRTYGRNDLSAEIALTMDCRYAIEKIPPRTVHVEGTFRFRQIVFDALTPWLDGGVTGTALYER